VIPPAGGFETARYGDRPFPVVPVDYSDRAHDVAASTASKLASKINDPATPGSTFNLYQEISFGQLFPHATVPSDGVTTAGWTGTYNFTKAGNAACSANTKATLGTYASGPRIANGWYQLPGDTTYYGLDGKAVYDAALIADDEIDYDSYDTDKDGVVDFFMMVFPGTGGNGASQTELPPDDNIWPHSSDLQGAFTDANGEKGYVTKDQSHDREGRPLFWTDATRSQKTTTDTGIKVFTRVGPYNVNPETALAHASVISHEYGHSLGLPDYYSTGSRETYGSWTLMATDYSQNIDVIGKTELGWLLPRVLEPGQRVAANWEDTKKDTNRIDWKRADGTTYTLTGPTVHNGEAYIANLPGRRLVDPALVPSGTHVLGQRLRLPARGRTQRLRSGNHRREDVQVLCVGQELHDAGLAEPQRQRLPDEVRQRPHRLQRVLRGGYADGRPARGQRRHAGLRGRLLRHLRPDRQAGRGAALRLRHRPGPGAAGLVHG